MSVVRRFASKLLTDRTAIRPGVDDLISLLRRYVIQETIAPLRALARGLAIALAGALVFAIGAVFTLVAVLRLLQTETGRTFAGDWTFVPYLLTAVVGLLFIGLAALATARTMSSSRARRP